MENTAAVIRKAIARGMSVREYGPMCTAGRLSLPETRHTREVGYAVRIDLTGQYGIEDPEPAVKLLNIQYRQSTLRFEGRSKRYFNHLSKFKA